MIGLKGGDVLTMYVESLVGIDDIEFDVISICQAERMGVESRM